MFYRYEHYMSISHIALIANIVHMIIWPQSLAYPYHGYSTTGLPWFHGDDQRSWLRTIRNLFRSCLFRRSREREREKTQGPQKIRNKEKRPKTRRTNSAPTPERKRRKVQHEKEKKKKNSATPKEKRKKKRREKKRKKEVTQLNSKKKKRHEEKKKNKKVFAHLRLS